MTHDNLITIEKELPLSQSKLWEYRTAYYQQSGINARSGEATFFIANNPYVAYCYARLIISYIRDCLRSAGDHAQPFYIIELGAGCGQFSFYCAKQLLKLKEQLQLDVDICYIMSDFVEESIVFWQQQEVLQPLFEAGILDCALYDLEQPQGIKLRQRGNLLKEKEVMNPLTVIANYVIDSTMQDGFRIIDGCFHEALISLRCEEGNLDNNSWPKQLNKIRHDFCYRPLKKEGHHYHQPHWNQVLNTYVDAVDNSSFSLPVGMFCGLDYLRQLSNNQLMLLATDSAYTNMADFSTTLDSNLIFQENCFSFTANFHALGEYFRQQDGRIFQQQTRGEFDAVTAQTAVFILTDAPDQLADTLLAIDDQLHQLSPMDYFSIHHFIRQCDFDFHSCLTELSLCGWDPYVLSSYMKLLEIALPKAGEITVSAFVAGMEQVASNIYPLPAMTDYYFIIARIYHIGRQYDKANAFYQQSLQLAMGREDSRQLFRSQLYLGRCYQAAAQYSLALAALQAAEALQPDNEEVKSDLEHLQKELP